MSKKIVVAMSGGVDSSVAALLLREQGYEVQGVFMKNWSPETLQGLDDCPWQQDQDDAEAACKHLDIPFRSVNFEREYRDRVLNYFFREYAAGRTPNPDIMCNKEIKFKAFLTFSQELGADTIATGHYANVGNGVLSRGIDQAKDQSYFLSGLSKVQLRSSIFPLGNLLKTEVRAIAKKAGLPNAEKKDSQGICFIGHLDVQRFLREHLSQGQGGKVYLVPQYLPPTSLEERLASSVEVGEYSGSQYITIGERAGQLVNNKRVREARGGDDVPPLFLLVKNQSKSALYVTADRDDPHFYIKELPIQSWEYLDMSDVQIRYGQQIPTVAKAIVRNNQMYVQAQDRGFYAPAAGQQAVGYNKDNEVVASSIILSPDEI